jgi:hypothetical protein
MAHRNASRPERAEGEEEHRPVLRAAEQTPIAGDGSAGRVARRGRRSGCLADGESVPAAGAQPRRSRGRTDLPDMEPLDILIVQQWTKSLKGPYDWGDWPLARYTIGPGVLQAVEQRASGSARRASPAVRQLAWACAMVACGRAQRLRSLDPRPLRDDSEEQLVRPDGAVAWHCNLERDTPEGPQLHYWIHPSGRVEFDTVLAPRQEPCHA